MSNPRFPNESAGTAVIALGGNALAPAGERSDVYDQFRYTRASLGPIVDLVSAGIIDPAMVTTDGKVSRDGGRKRWDDDYVAPDGSHRVLRLSVADLPGRALRR